MNWNELRLNDRQQKLLDLFRDGKERDLDDVIVYFGNDVWRNSVISSIKGLSAKIVPLGFHIVRTTPLGRGHRAIYRMEKIKPAKD